MRHAYTDGSVAGPRGGASVHFTDTRETLRCGVSTNDVIIAELRGVLLAVQHTSPGTELLVHTDSSGIPDLISRPREHPRSDIQTLVNQIRVTARKRDVTLQVTHVPRTHRHIRKAHIGANQARRRDRDVKRKPEEVRIEIHLGTRQQEAIIRLHTQGGLQTFTEVLDHDLGIDLPLQAIGIALEHAPEGSRVTLGLASPLTRAYLERGKNPGNPDVARQVRLVQALIRGRSLKLNWQD